MCARADERQEEQMAVSEKGGADGLEKCNDRCTEKKDSKSSENCET